MEQIDKELWDLREEIHLRENLMRRYGWTLWEGAIEWRYKRIFELLKQKFRAVTPK